MRISLLILIVLIVCGSADRAESQDATEASALMPRVEDYTSMWWAEGFPAIVPKASWCRCVQTGYDALVLDTETLQIPHLGPVPAGTSYLMCGQGDAPVWERLAPAELELNLTLGR